MNARWPTNYNAENVAIRNGQIIGVRGACTKSVFEGQILLSQDYAKKVLIQTGILNHRIKHDIEVLASPR